MISKKNLVNQSISGHTEFNYTGMNSEYNNKTNNREYISTVVAVSPSVLITSRQVGSIRMIFGERTPGNSSVWSLLCVVECDEMFPVCRPPVSPGC